MNYLFYEVLALIISFAWFTFVVKEIRRYAISMFPRIKPYIKYQKSFANQMKNRIHTNTTTTMDFDHQTYPRTSTAMTDRISSPFSRESIVTNASIPMPRESMSPMNRNHHYPREPMVLANIISPMPRESIVTNTIPMPRESMSPMNRNNHYPREPMVLANMSPMPREPMAMMDRNFYYQRDHMVPTDRNRMSPYQNYHWN
ncbi:hypothetical protein RDWZM_001182 [Blomia tropicalis]|uniref:Uncharacterized protein n=1 Tax=Blomia tropicalis TaxID=40697 RepID=A0A9Q0MBR5_BLOTA|nr:hypothetical protein RDWZM_001182 [Blomia tropicalis]